MRSETVARVEFTQILSSLVCTRILLVLMLAYRVPCIPPRNQLGAIPGQIVFVCRVLRARMEVRVCPAGLDSTKPWLGLQPAKSAPKANFRHKKVQHQYLPVRTVLQESIHQIQEQQFVEHVSREHIWHRPEATPPQIAHLAPLAPTRVRPLLFALCVLSAVTRSAQGARCRRTASARQAIQKLTEAAWLVSLASSSRQWDRMNVKAVRSEVIQSRGAPGGLIARVCLGLRWTVACALLARLAPTRMLMEIKRALRVQQTPNQTKRVHPSRTACACLDFPVQMQGLVSRARPEHIRSPLVHYVKVVLSTRPLRPEAMSAGTASAWLVSLG